MNFAEVIRRSNPKSKQVKHFFSVSQEIEATFINEKPNYSKENYWSYIIADSLMSVDRPDYRSNDQFWSILFLILS